MDLKQSRKSLLGRVTSVSGLSLLLMTACSLGAAQAATYSADTVSDDASLNACTSAAGDCSLRGAIGNANASIADDIINFDASLLNTTIVLGGSELSIANNGSLVINGLGANRLSVSGNGVSRVFLINSSAVVTINDLKITNGFNSYGAGFIVYGNLTLNNSTVSGNYAEYGSGINNYGTTTLNNSTVSGNYAYRYGGGIHNHATMTLTNSTISGNLSGLFGGGIFNNPTFGDGAVRLTAIHSTITGNTGYSGGGVDTSSGYFLLKNSIVAGNSVSYQYGKVDISGSVDSRGYNLIGNTNGSFNSWVSTDVTDTDAKLSALDDNGGPTQTHAIGFDSPALNAGNSSLTTDPTTDQRGFPRPFGNAPDIGAFELQATPPPLPIVAFDGTFETPTTTGIAYNATGGSWSFASNSGVQRNGSAFGASTAPDGVQTAFLQGSNGRNGSIATRTNFTAGTYRLSFQAALRNVGSIQSFDVFFDDTKIDSFSPTTTSFAPFTTSTFTATEGAHTIKFVGTSTSGDNTAFLDVVTIDAIIAPTPTPTPTPTPLTISVSDASVIEGNSGTTTLLFPVTLSASSTQSVSVNYQTANGNAIAGNTSPSDYAARSGVLTFTPGQTLRYISVVVRGDLYVENDETFTIGLSNSINATLNNATATGTIFNDDGTALPSVSVADVSLSEGNSGTKSMVFTFTLDKPSESAITLNFATQNGTATAGNASPADYASRSGVVTFAPNQTSRTVAVTIYGDTRIETSETFKLNLSGASGATMTQSFATGTITNDD